jgi:hypothetical protein
MSIGKWRELTGQADLQPINPARKRDSTGRDGLSGVEIPPGLTIDVADAFAAQLEHRLAALPQNPCKIVRIGRACDGARRNNAEGTLSQR